MAEVAQVLSQEEVLEQLMTRGFEDGFQKTPLRDFWGMMESYTGEMRQGNNGSYLVVLYNFKDIEVIDSSEPYTSPIAQIEIGHSTRTKSAMGYWGASVDAVINADVPPDVMPPDPRLKNQDYLIGKMGHYRFTPGCMMWDGQEKKEMPRSCWKLVELRDGAVSDGQPGAQPTGPSAAARALELLDGKTENDWHQAAFVDPIVKADQGLINSIISRSFLEPYMLAGRVTKDEATGIYTVAPE